MSMAWARCHLRDEALLGQLCEELTLKHEDGLLLQEGAESQIANIISALSELRYKDEPLTEAIFECLTGPNYAETGEIDEQYDLYTLSSVISSLAIQAPDKTHYFKAFAPQLHNALSTVVKTDRSHFVENPGLVYMLVPDLTLYMNLWLTMATFASQQPNYSNMTVMPSEFNLVAKDLIRIFNENPRWRGVDMNFIEAANISVAIAILKVNNEKFIGDISDIIRANLQYKGEEMPMNSPLQMVEPEDLPNIAKSSFYMRTYPTATDIYA